VQNRTRRSGGGDSQSPPAAVDPNLLVGLDTSDDAGVYRLSEELAMVQTVDFFTPIVDDPYDFGQVAAANAISDIYAMGAKPLTALNIVAFPISTLDKQVLADILRGASDKLREAGVALVGGHSIDDKEPKFGLAVTGIVHPDRVRTNAGAKPGDRLLLTKPIGVGILTTSLKKERLSAEEIARMTSVMTTLNKRAAETMEPFDVHACTDVTGFGLIGHSLEMARGSGAGIRLSRQAIPVLPRVRELAEQGFIPGGTKNNFNHVRDHVSFPDDMDQTDRWILCDAVTSGGLLIAVAGEEADRLLERLRDAGVDARAIGEVTQDHPAESWWWTERWRKPPPWGSNALRAAAGTAGAAKERLMFQDMTWEELLARYGRREFVLIDVRSPSEYAESTIPGSLNVPLFDDTERAEIGTLYKQKSAEAAKERGLEIVSAKLPAFIRRFAEMPGRKVVFCWRGGMRSKTTATVLSLMDIHACRLTGGYRAYRKWVVDSFESLDFQPPFYVLHGHTAPANRQSCNC